jgi:hypothetical protein
MTASDGTFAGGSALRAAEIATIPLVPTAALDMLADVLSQHIHISVKAIRGQPDMSNPGKTHHRSRSHRDRRAMPPLFLDRSRAAIGQRNDVCGFWLFPRRGGAG